MPPFPHYQSAASPDRLRAPRFWSQSLSKFNMPSPIDDETPFPTLTYKASSTFNGYGRSHLSPDDAFVSPPRRPYPSVSGVADPRRLLVRIGSDRSRSRRRKRTWKKLMWVKQSYPDNYTDQATFLENLQRNPRLKPYDFWPLVADSTVILQHVCSVILFIVFFIGIFQERVSPVSVVSWSSVGTFLGWILWERWVSEAEDQDDTGPASVNLTVIGRTGSSRRPGRAGSIRRPPPFRPESTSSTAVPSASPSAASSTTNLHLQPIPIRSPSGSTVNLGSQNASRPSHTPRASQDHLPEMPPPYSSEVNRAHQRLETIKSALLIYSTLLGLSPILKSLTRSTSSDSIWAMSFWLLAINIFFFDYSGGVGAKFPASLSTNAGLMASTVLASRLPSTKEVFSLTLFSIQVFGLFPVFRRYVRHRSWQYHVVSAVLLVLGAGLGVGFVLGDDKDMDGYPWKSGFVGMMVGALIAVFATGGCSWWLIGLQKYKNEIRGPWDPARPIIMSRPRWDDDT